MVHNFKYRNSSFIAILLFWKNCKLNSRLRAILCLSIYDCFSIRAVLYFKMCHICFSFIHVYQVTPKVKEYFCKLKPDINIFVYMASNASLSILKNIHKLWGSQRTVDNSVINAWNSPNFWHFHIRGGTQQDLYAGFLLIRLLLIAPRIL